MNKLISQLAEMLNFVNGFKFTFYYYAKETTNTAISTFIRL